MDGRVNQRARAFAPALGLGPPKGASIDQLSGAGASAGVCLLPWGGAVGPQCWIAGWLCAFALCCVRCGPRRLLCWGGLWG